jgi:hypothetical protein
MLKLLFRRLKELIDAEGRTKVAKHYVRNLPVSLLNAFAGRLNLENYLLLDDATVNEFFKCACQSSDPVLKDLGIGILNRKLYKAADITGFEFERKQAFTKQVANHLKSLGKAPDYCFVEDSASDTPYKLYDPGSGKVSKVIYVEDPRSTIVEISRISDPVKQLIQKSTSLRYYFPEDVRQFVDDAFNAHK